MSLKTKALIGLTALIIGVTGWFCIGLITLVTPTKGTKISRYASPHKALLVIDIQEDSTGTTAKNSSPFKNDSEKYITSVNQIINSASKGNIGIIYIRHEFQGLRGMILSRITSDGVDIKGQPGTEIDKRVSIISNNIFSKSVSDAFSNPDLEAYLINQQVDELFLTGIDAQYCVYSTAKGALNRGYKVNLITDGISMANKNKWNEVMEKYKQDGVKLVTSSQTPF